MIHKEQKIEAQLTITRTSHSQDGDRMRVSIRDQASGIEFAKVYIGMAEFCEALTGRAFVKCDGIARGLEFVGMKHEVQNRTALAPQSLGFDRQKLEKWIVENCQEEGWHVSPNLGSQRSIGRVDESGTRVNYHVERWVPVEEVANG